MVYRKEPRMAVRICTGCTVCRGAMDGKERCMYRMYGILQGAREGGVHMSIYSGVVYDLRHCERSAAIP